MMVSMAMAVLPVCRSPMISSRWPRPTGVIASIALMPVWSGWLTLARWTTEGAPAPAPAGRCPRCLPCRPAALRARPPPGPGRRRRPGPKESRRSGGPAGLRPKTLVKSPRMTTPISRTSRLSARPRIPPGNSSSSLAIAEGRPSTCAMPSPASATTPTSCREAPSGSSPGRSSPVRPGSRRAGLSAPPWSSRLSRWNVGCLPVSCRRAAGRAAPRAEAAAPRHQDASRCRSWASRLATLPSMNSSPIWTDIPPTTRGSTTTFR